MRRYGERAGSKISHAKVVAYLERMRAVRDGRILGLNYRIGGIIHRRYAVADYYIIKGKRSKIYYVSNVYSTEGTVYGRNFAWRKMSYLNEGYVSYSKGTLLHRILCFVFFEATGSYDLFNREVDHLNMIKYDNRVLNLEVVSHSENMRRCYNNKTKNKH